MGSLVGRGAIPCLESTAQRKLRARVAVLDAWWSVISAQTQRLDQQLRERVRRERAGDRDPCFIE